MTKEKGHGADSMPSSLTELAPIVSEFVEKLKSLRNEQELLKTQEKELFEEYEDKLDVKTLKLALRAVSLKEKVEHKDAFDNLCEVLERGLV